MNQKNGKNSLGLDKCFEETENPIELFKKWFAKAEETEINDPNAVAVATVDKNNQPSVRMVLLKGLSDKGFVFYTNFNSKKGNDLKINKKSSMCFHWKSLLRQVRITGKILNVSETDADNYYNSRSYERRIGAWASNQSSILKSRDELLKLIQELKNKYPNEKNLPRPSHWSGWILAPEEIEFWLDVKNRSHERLNYILKEGNWIKEILYP